MSRGSIYLIPNVIAAGTEEAVISPQVREIIPGIDYFLVENLRTARRYISALKLGVDIPSLQLELLNKDTGWDEAYHLLEPLREGRDAGIISESGCPGIADPGSAVVALAHEEGLRVVPLSGPSSIFLALMASGFNGQKFAFHGYLPIKSNERKKAIQQLELESAKTGQTQIFMETPYRNQALFDAVVSVCRPQSKLCIACEVTGNQEFIQTRSVKKWSGDVPNLNKRPTIFLLYAG